MVAFVTEAAGVGVTDYARASVELAFVKRNEFYAEAPQGYGIAVFYARGLAHYVATRSEHRDGDERVPAVELARHEAQQDDETARRRAYRECVTACEQHYSQRADIERIRREG